MGDQGPLPESQELLQRLQELLDESKRLQERSQQLRREAGELSARLVDGNEEKPE